MSSDEEAIEVMEVIFLYKEQRDRYRKALVDIRDYDHPTTGFLGEAKLLKDLAKKALEEE